MDVVKRSIHAVLMMLALLVAPVWAADTVPPSSTPDKVYVNQASAEELAEYLDGIGQSKAEAIVAYRQNNGPFTDLASLKAVKGVGDKTLEKNASRIVFDAQSDSKTTTPAAAN